MKNLFVGNLGFKTTENELQELFKPFGQVTRVHIATDRETGRSRGFAFIEMPNDDEALKAMAGLNGKELSGRSLRVNEATPRSARGPAAPPNRGGSNRGSSRGSNFSNEDYREVARQPREPRW